MMLYMSNNQVKKNWSHKPYLDVAVEQQLTNTMKEVEPEKGSKCM